MKPATTSPSPDPKARSILPPATTAGIPRTAEPKTLSTSTTTSVASSSISQPNTHSRSHSYPFPFHAKSLSRSTTNDSVFHSRSRSRSKSPSCLPSLSTSSPQTTPITTRPMPMPSGPKRVTSDSAVSPTLSSPTTKTHPSKKPKNSPASTSHCGRHSNDWLFGGFSVTETVKGFIHKDDEEK